MTEPGTRSPQVVWREFGYSQPLRVFLHNVPDHFLRNLRSPDSTPAANASEYLAVRYLCHSLPVVDRLLHPSRHWNCANVPSFSYEVNDGPVVLSALNMIEAQVNEFFSTEPTPQENRQDGSISLTLHAVHVWKLPQGAGFLYGQPISKPHSELFCSLHATDPRSQIGAKQSSVRRLIGESSDGGKPHVDGARCEQPIFEMNPVARHHHLTERKSRLRAVPSDKILDRTSIAPLRF